MIGTNRSTQIRTGMTLFIESNLALQWPKFQAAYNTINIAYAHRICG